MSGYNPAGTPPQLPQLNWFQRWRARRRHRKAERKRNWMVLMAAFTVPDKDKEEMIHFLNAMSDDDILCPIGRESYRQ